MDVHSPPTAKEPIIKEPKETIEATLKPEEEEPKM